MARQVYDLAEELPRAGVETFVEVHGSARFMIPLIGPEMPLSTRPHVASGTRAAGHGQTDTGAGRALALSSVCSCLLLVWLLQGRV